MRLEDLYDALTNQKNTISRLEQNIELQTLITYILIGLFILLLVLIVINIILKFKIKNKMKFKIQSRKNKIFNLDKNERNIFTIIFSLIIALIVGYFSSEKTYFETSTDFANGSRISEQEYISRTSDGDYSYVFTKFDFNYLIFFSVLIIVLGLFYILLNKKNANSNNVLKQAQETAIPLVINGYRKVGKERNCAPTIKTSDKKIIEIYQKVLIAFNNAAKEKNEKIPAVKLNFIALKFFQVYEMMGEAGLENHLEYEVEKYSEGGLREEYNQTLELF